MEEYLKDIDANLPSDTPDVARELIRQLVEECRQLKATVAAQQNTIGELQEEITSLQLNEAKLTRALFGNRRERFESPDQGMLFDYVDLDEIQQGETSTTDSTEDELPEGDGNPSASDGRSDADSSLQIPQIADSEEGESPGTRPDQKAKKRRRNRRLILDALPRERRERKLNDDDIPEDMRGDAGRRFFKKIGEWVEYVPPTLKLVEEFSETLAVDNEDQTGTKIVSAPKTARIISGLAGPSLLAYLTVSRFFDHLPYYRMEDIFQRSGVLFGRSTQTRWMAQVAKAAMPLIDVMRTRALQSLVVQADETPVKLIDRDQPGQAVTSYLWAVLGDAQYPYTTFYFTKDRSRKGPDQFFANFQGYLVSDAYICYELLSAESRGRIRQAGCFAHARRKFEELDKLGSTRDTSTALGYFQRLFSIEDQLSHVSDAQRHEIRQQVSRPLLVNLKQWMDDKLSMLRPKASLRSAIQYMTNRWDCFTSFLESGSIPLDNNAAERAVKLPVIGKKNWLFMGSENGGHTAAAMFSLTATCRRLHINPLAYLTDVFERLPLCNAEDPASLEPLLPDKWLAEHPDARMEFREQEEAQRAARRSQRRDDLRREAIAARCA
jgi:hypothetical protein